MPEHLVKGCYNDAVSYWSNAVREPKQLPLPFTTQQEAEREIPFNYYNGRDLGTFKDSMRAPIYRWFRYPAGYSYKFVEASFDLFNVRSGDWIYDPFSGTGTTLICAKQNGINAYGVEAHAFVSWVADVKLFWEFDFGDFYKLLTKTLGQIDSYVLGRLDDCDIAEIFPELVYKCYHPTDLKTLYLIREYILESIDEVSFRDFLKLALTDTLRGAATAGTGWPYISPPRVKSEKPPKDALQIFQTTTWQMYADLRNMSFEIPQCEIQNKLGDSRERQDLPDEQIKLALTSPPYLNNYDYADRTRLETYFWGLAKSWSDITQQFRSKLMVAATTQVTRSQYDIETALSKKIEELNPNVYKTIQNKILQLAEYRLHKKGKKDYDIMTALYFNDIVQVLQETYRVLEKGGHFCLVMGDSAPYSVHIPTDDLVGELALSMGFQSYDYYELRKRGDKWKGNPQRHKVPLREGVVILSK